MRKIISVIWALFAQINSFAAVNNQHNVIKRVVDNPVGTQRRQRFSARAKVRLEFSFKAKLLDPLIWSIFSLNAEHDLPNKLSTPSTPHRLLPPISSSASGSLEQWASREKLAVVQSAGMKQPNTQQLRALRLSALARDNKVVNAIRTSITSAPDALVKELMDVHGWPAHEALCAVQQLQRGVLDDMTEQASA